MQTHYKFFFKVSNGIAFDLFCACIAVYTCRALCGVIELLSSDQFGVCECDITVISASLSEIKL